MRNTHIDLHDALDRALVAIGNDYPYGHLLDAHAHRRAQLLYGATGVMLVLSEDGGWVVPPQRAVWIPLASRTMCGCWGQHAQRLHRAGRGARGRAGLRSGGGVATVAPAVAGGRGHAGAVRQGRARRRAGPTAAARGGPRAGAAAAHPAAARRAAGALCQAFMAAPDIRSRPQDWAGRLHMSPRSFSRHFREHTGMSYAQWRQRACVVLALARLAAGDPVTVIALDFGYQGPTAFSTMFRRVLGAAPSAYLRTD
ncbi:helix-turn-helix transcriptional regulator [Achromobacter xylosoxidans]